MASTGNMKISVNVSKANGKVEKEKDGLFPKLRKGGSGSMTERRSGGRGHGESTTAAPNDGSQSARRPGEDKPKGRGKPPLVSSGSSNTKGMDKQRTPRPPSASAAKNGEQSSPSVAPTASATPGSSRATSPFASSTVRRNVKTGSSRVIMSASFDLTENEGVIADLAVVKAALASHKQGSADDAGSSTSPRSSNAAEGGISLGGLRFPPKAQLEELLRMYEGEVLRVSSSGEGAAPDGDDSQVDVAKRRQVKEAAARVMKILSGDGASGGKEAEPMGSRSVTARSKEPKLDEKAQQLLQKQAYVEGLKIVQDAEKEMKELREQLSLVKQARNQVTADKKAAEAALAETDSELKRKEDECYRQAGVIEKLEARIENLKTERDALGKELERTKRQSDGYRTQVTEEKAGFAEFKAKRDKEMDILEERLRQANTSAVEHYERLKKSDESVRDLEREKRRLEEGMALEKSSAQLERSTCDKYRVRVAELEQKWADALRGKETAESELKMTRAALDEAKHHLAESAVWHNARVQGRRTTRALLSLPPETQDLAFAQQGLVDHDAVMVSEFLINNLMIVTCDLSNNDIGAEGATALAQGLVNNRVLTSLNLKDNVVGPEGCLKLALMLAGNRVIEKLNLMGCDVGDEGCIALSEVLCMPQCSIQLLALRFNGIADAGAEAMSRALETNSSLTELGLNSNHITDEGIAALTVSLTRNSTLELLRITENPYGRESLKRLTNAKRDGLHLYF